MMCGHSQGTRMQQVNHSEQKHFSVDDPTKATGEKA